MIDCPHCGAKNQDGSEFCSVCGQPLPTPAAGGLPLSKKPAGELNPPLSPGASGDISEEMPPWLKKLLITHGLVKPEGEEEEPRQDRVAAPPVAEAPEPAKELPPLAEAETEGWPAALREPGEGPPPAEPEEPGEPVPADWLQTLRSEAEGRELETEEAAEPAGEAGLEEELPDWLRDLGEPGVEVEQAPPEIEVPGAEGEELPDWLRDLGEPGVEVEPEPPAEETPPLAEPPATPVTEEEELPAWLADLRGEEFEEEIVVPPAEATPPPEALAPEEPEKAPDWLQDLGIAEGEEGEPSETPALIIPEIPEAPLPESLLEEAEEAEGGEKPEIEIPQWLQEIQAGEPALPEEAPEEEGKPPDWLAQPTTPDLIVEAGEIPIPDWLQGPAPSAEAEMVEEEEVTPPDWLQELGPAVPSPSEAEEQPSELPSWLQELQPAAEASAKDEVPPFVGEGWDLEPPIPEAPAPAPEGEPEEEVEGLARAEIPDWLLALRPREPGEEPGEEPEIMELSGPLAGIKGVLPVEPIISLPHLTRPEAVAVEALPVSGDLFAEIVAQPPVSATPVPRRRSARVVAGVQRVLIYLLVLAAVVVPLLMGPIYGPLDAADLRGGADDFYPLLEALPAGAVVIVAFDYNPATAAELSLQARAIVGHLMGRDLRIMAISLYPEGAALASDILDELAEAHGYTYGENYIHLGYLPNQPASVRYFLDKGPAGDGRNDYREGEPVGRYAVAQGVDDLSAVSLVVELAGDVRTLQTWVEQMTVRTNVPLVAGVSAATAPYVQPYLDSGQLQALLVGLPGAAQYEAQSGREGDAIKSLGSQVAAQGVVLLLIFLGNLVHLATRGGKK